MRISKSTKTSVTASNYPKYICRDGHIGTFQRVDPGADGEEIPIYKFPGGESMADDSEIAKGSDTRDDLVCASTTNAEAIKYIKAAINVLGKSGNKDAVTKDSIANLATVMFDLKGSEK